MFLDERTCDIKILTVLKLSWDGCEAEVSPRNFHAISYRHTGGACFKAGGGTLYPTSGDVIYVPEKLGYRITSGYEEVYVVHFKTNAKTEKRLELFDTKNNARIQTLFAACYDAWSKKEPCYRFRTLSIFYTILEVLSTSASPRPEDEKYRKLKPAIDRLQADFRNPALTVRDLAQELYVSETYFRRLFGEVFGTTPNKYINLRRVIYAKDLIKIGLYSIETIAEMSGFSSSKYFSTVFKQHTGLSPTDYRKNKV